MKALMITPRMRHSMVTLVLAVALVGCGESVTGPGAVSVTPNSGSADPTNSATSVALVGQIETASFEQLRALAACVPSDAGLPDPPVVTRASTLAEIVALTPRITAFRVAVVDYFRTLPLGQVVTMTPCISTALRITDGSGDAERARIISEELARLSLLQILAIRDCLGPEAKLPEAPALSANPTLGEITRLTPELRAYHDAVLEYLGGLTLGEVVELSPCLNKIGVPVS